MSKMELTFLFRDWLLTSLFYEYLIKTYCDFVTCQTLLVNWYAGDKKKALTLTEHNFFQRAINQK